MNNHKKVALVMIVVGAIITLLGVFNIVSKEEKKNSGKVDEEKIPKTKEDIAAVWIGEYESDKNNSYYVIFETFDKAQILSFRFDNDYLLPVSSINYNELIILSDSYKGNLKRNKKDFSLNFESSYNTNENIEEVYTKKKDSVWTGIYRNESKNVFITQVSDNLVYVSFYLSGDSFVEHSGSIINREDESTQNNEQLITDKTLKYVTADGDTFTISSDKDLVAVEYSGSNEKYDVFNGTYKKYVF